jgi:hypothetical protein
MKSAARCLACRAARAAQHALSVVRRPDERLLTVALSI